VSTLWDLGFGVTYGNLWGGHFNAGFAWGAWNGGSPYDVHREHVFGGYEHGF
jgi:hypothetical protein